MAQIGPGPFSERKEVQTHQSDVSSKQSVNNYDNTQKKQPLHPLCCLCFCQRLELSFRVSQLSWDKLGNRDWHLF